jgi:hypothetical protein
VGLAGIETGSELSKNSNIDRVLRISLYNVWFENCSKVFGKNVGLFNIVSDFRLIGATNLRSGFDMSKDFFGCFPMRAVCWI